MANPIHLMPFSASKNVQEQNLTRAQSLNISGSQVSSKQRRVFLWGLKKSGLGVETYGRSSISGSRDAKQERRHREDVVKWTAH